MKFVFTHLRQLWAHELAHRRRDGREAIARDVVALPCDRRVRRVFRRHAGDEPGVRARAACAAPGAPFSGSRVVGLQTQNCKKPEELRRFGAAYRTPYARRKGKAASCMGYQRDI